MVNGRVVVKDGRLADTRWESLNARAYPLDSISQSSAGRH